MADQAFDWREFLLSFDGRIGRSHLWLRFFLPYIVAAIVISVIDGLLGGTSILILIFSIVVIWPNLAVYAKRWHDRNKSGWWSLILLIPIVGGLWMLVECGFLKGTDGSNRFGEDPVPA